MLNHTKTSASKRIVRQFQFGFIYSCNKYGIDVFRDCAKVYLKVLQVIQNELLKLLLNYDRRTPADLLHQQLSLLLKVPDIHDVNVLSFVNECRSGRCPVSFTNYFPVRAAGPNVRQNDR